MNLNSTKKYIISQIGCLHDFVYFGSRNQSESFSGCIIKCYSSIFLIMLSCGSTKSFSYNDFIIGNLKIY